MRDTLVAGAAKKQHSFHETLRIREAEPAVAMSSSAAQTSPARQANAEKLRNRLASLQTSLQRSWRWLERKRTQQLSSRRLRVAESISLGEKRSVSIVQVDGAQYLIGCSAGSVQLLAVLDKQDARRVMKFEGGS